LGGFLSPATPSVSSEVVVLDEGGRERVGADSEIRDGYVDALGEKGRILVTYAEAVIIDNDVIVGPETVGLEYLITEAVISPESVPRSFLIKL
jgi:hypothetical protein